MDKVGHYGNPDMPMPSDVKIVLHKDFPNEYNITPEEYNYLLEVLVKQLSKYNKPDGIIAVSRGGLAIAQTLASVFDVRLVISIATIGYDENKQQLPSQEMVYMPDLTTFKDKHWWIVDKMDDSGRTNALIEETIVKAGGNATRIVLISKPDNHVHYGLPDVVGRDIAGDTWVNFPLETYADYLKEKYNIG